MNEIEKPFLLRAKSDFEYQDNGLLFTAELKARVTGTMTVDWFASGLDPQGNLRCFLTTRISCSAMNEPEAHKQIEAMLPAIVSLAQLARTSNGLSQASRNEIVLQSVEKTIALHLSKHLAKLDSEGMIPSAAARTAIETAFCKSVGLTKYVEFLARFEGVPISTIRRRLDNARTLGLIPKRGESDD